MNIPSSFLRGGLAILLLLTCPLALEAGITRLVIDSTQPAQGPAFAAMPYEVIQGRAFGELDPRDRRNAIITDLNLAPRNARGLVEYEATFTLWKPIDLAKASGLLMYGVSNRGGGVNPADYNVARGDVFLNSGWQGDIAFQSSAQTIRVPIAKNPDGSSVTGVVLTRFPQTAASPTLALPPPPLPPHARQSRPGSGHPDPPRVGGECRRPDRRHGLGLC